MTIKKQKYNNQELWDFYTKNKTHIYQQCLEYFYNQVNTQYYLMFIDDIVSNVFLDINTKIKEKQVLYPSLAFIKQVCTNYLNCWMESNKLRLVAEKESTRNTSKFVFVKKANDQVTIKIGLPNRIIDKYLNYFSAKDKENMLYDGILEIQDNQALNITSLFYIENLTIHQIQEKTGLTYNQLKQHLKTGKRQLRQYLTNKIDSLEKITY